MDSEKCGSTLLSQLRWQCRRGMKELDTLLTAYLETRYDIADDTEKAYMFPISSVPKCNE